MNLSKYAMDHFGQFQWNGLLLEDRVVVSFVRRQSIIFVFTRISSALVFCGLINSIVTGQRVCPSKKKRKRRAGPRFGPGSIRRQAHLISMSSSLGQTKLLAHRFSQHCSHGALLPRQAVLRHRASPPLTPPPAALRERHLSGGFHQ